MKINKFIFLIILFYGIVALAQTPPKTTTTGNQSYCPQTSKPIVETIAITPSSLGEISTTSEVSIQISSGYVVGQDELQFINTSSIIGNWNDSEGKLTLSSATSGGSVTYTDFENAIKTVNFYNPSASISGSRDFSINIGVGGKSYLPRNKHFYEYVPNLGITWSNAKIEASGKFFFGLQGYLATLTAADEAQLAGKQAPGTGWIGGTDEQTEGVWKWVTGPEAGTIMSYINWNNNEPNNAGGNENYAHITHPNLPNSTKGSWNDLPNAGGSGLYAPQGYIVEYGGMPDDPIIDISASTTLTVAKITNTTPASRCGAGTITLNATASIGIIEWYNTISGGASIASGTNFTNPSLSSTENYYAEISGCPSTRTVITATINATPTVSTTKPSVSRCGAGTVVLEATPSIGNINWFYDATGGTQIGTGTIFTTPSLETDTIFYAEANNNGCFSSNRVAINTSINPLPIVTDETVILCQSSSVTLDASLFGMTYLWSTSENTKTINVSTSGNYNVAITNSFTCTSTKTITVAEHQIPEIDAIKVIETAVEIVLKNPQNYFEYSIDGLNFQNSPLFLNAPGGLQTASIREINGCGIDTEDFVVLLAPPFFTPNNDSFNDFWTVKGMNYYPNAELRIFDRYGKFLKELRPTSIGWDGTFNGQELPASDYWFVFKMDATAPEKRGHFTLKR